MIEIEQRREEWFEDPAQMFWFMECAEADDWDVHFCGYDTILCRWGFRATREEEDCAVCVYGDETPMFAPSTRLRWRLRALASRALTYIADHVLAAADRLAA